MRADESESEARDWQEQRSSAKMKFSLLNPSSVSSLCAILLPADPRKGARPAAWPLFMEVGGPTRPQKERERERESLDP